MPARKFVIVRTRDAGVHIGELKSRKDGEVVLANAVRLWRWRGANTLHEVATEGVAQEWTRISTPVDEITIIGACEIIQCTAKARKTFVPRWAQ